MLPGNLTGCEEGLSWHLTPAVAPSKIVVVWSWLIPLGFHTEELPSSRSKVLRGGDFSEGESATVGVGKTVGASEGGSEGGSEVEEGVRLEDKHRGAGGGGGEEETGVGARGAGRAGMEERGRRDLAAGGRGGGRDGGSGVDFAGGGGLGRDGRVGGRWGGEVGEVGEVGVDGGTESAGGSQASIRGQVWLRGKRGKWEEDQLIVLNLITVTSRWHSR